MAEVKTNDEEKREPFKIEVDKPFAFDAIASSKFITSNELAKLTSDLFRNVFADFEGSIFEVSTQGGATMSLIFNHGNYDKDAITACERLNSKSVGATVIDRGRSRDSLLRDGDRYFLTEDGKDVVKDLIVRRLYNNGKPDYSKIVGEYTDRGPVNNYFIQQTPQYTKVSHIDLNRLCGLLFGSVDEDGNSVEYSVAVTAPINAGYNNMTGIAVSTNYILNITQVSSKELNDLCTKLGLGVSGLAIVR